MKFLIVALVVGFILERMFPNVKRILRRLTIGLSALIWIIVSGISYGTLHTIVSHSVQSLDFALPGGLTARERAEVQAALRDLDKRALRRIAILPLLQNSFYKRAVSLSMLAVGTGSWNLRDFEVWMACYREDTPVRRAQLEEWVNKIRKNSNDFHAPSRG